MLKTLKRFRRFCQSALIALDQKEQSGDRFAMLENWIIIVLLGLLPAVLGAVVCWTIIDMLIPAVVGTDYHYGAIWAALQRVSALSGVVDHCDLERTLEFRLHLLTTLSVVCVCIGTGLDFRQWIMSEIRPNLVTLYKRVGWLFLIYALFVAVLVARQPINYAWPAEKSWCDQGF